MLIQKNQDGRVRAIDIANEMHFSKAAVSIALKKLKEDGFITIDDMGYISLTDDGNLVASDIYQRHLTIRDALIQIGVDAQTAYADACEMEHVISDETFDCMKEFVRKR